MKRSLFFIINLSGFAFLAGEKENKNLYRR